MSNLLSTTARSVRAAVAVFAMGVAVAAVAGVLVARHRAAQAYGEVAPRFASLSALVPFYPGARFFPMGEAVTAQGVDRELGYAVSADAVGKVADRYEAIWQSQGFVVDRRDVGEEAWVSARDRRDPWVRSILATRAGDRTFIVASVRDLSRPPAATAVPRPASCMTVSDDAARDRGVFTQQLLLDCRATLDELVDFYDGALHGATRQARLGADGSAGTALVTYAEPRREVRLVAQEGEPGADGAPRTSVSLTWQEGR